MAPPAKVVVKRSGTAEAKIAVSLRDGFHVNSNTPAEDYLIPLRLTWAPGGLTAAGVAYPKPQLEKYEFSPNPISVYTGSFQLVTRLKAGTQVGPGMLVGKLRYQACNNKACFAPKTVEITLPYQIE